MVKRIKLKGENKKASTWPLWDTTIPLLYSDFCYRLQHGATSFKKQN